MVILNLIIILSFIINNFITFFKNNCYKKRSYMWKCDECGAIFDLESIPEKCPECGSEDGTFSLVD